MPYDDKATHIKEIMDDFAYKHFGMTPGEAIAQRKCVICHSDATIFRDKLSRREYAISALCQKCQDETFKEE